jgi:hypothetical protein
MKKILLSVAAVAALAAAVPASAQRYERDYDRYERGYDNDRSRSGYVSSRGFVESVEARANVLEDQIYRARQSGRVSKAVGNSVLGQLRATVKLAYNYRRDGLAQSEVRAIDERFREMERRLRYDRGDRYQRDYGFRW